jgi:hypothetical protein
MSVCFHRMYMSTLENETQIDQLTVYGIILSRLSEEVFSFEGREYNNNEQQQ